MSISGYPVQQTSRVSALKFIRRFHTSVRFAIPTSIIPGIVSSVILNRASIMKSFLALRTEKRQVFTTLTLQWAFFFLFFMAYCCPPCLKYLRFVGWKQDTEFSAVKVPRVSGPNVQPHWSTLKIGLTHVTAYLLFMTITYTVQKCLYKNVLFGCSS